jgi:hypothetical protein
MVIAIVAVFAVVVFVARGRGGELSAERADYVPLDLGPLSATDVALLRPPTGLWGYNMQATDEAMGMIAESIRERDVRIVALEQLVTDLSRDQAPALPLGSPYPGARHRRDTAPYPVARAPFEPAAYPDPYPYEPAAASKLEPVAYPDESASDPAATVPDTPPFSAESAEPAPTADPVAQQPLTAPPFAAPPFTEHSYAEQPSPDQARAEEPQADGDVAEQPAGDPDVTEQVRPPFDFGRRPGATSGPPPEQSHD